LRHRAAASTSTSAAGGQHGRSGGIDNAGTLTLKDTWAKLQAKGAA